MERDSEENRAFGTFLRRLCQAVPAFGAMQSLLLRCIFVCFILLVSVGFYWCLFITDMVGSHGSSGSGYGDDEASRAAEAFASKRRKMR